MTVFYLIHVKNYPIFQQLQLEEALLRNDQRNFCIINEGSSPAIVMGISGKPHELIDNEYATEARIPIIKRFSGGGTVVVDEDTLFVSFICQKSSFSFPAYPERIAKWSEEFYTHVFEGISAFHLRENDYVLGEKKCGGNAQYIRKERWLHHTSFLWDYKPSHMQCLLHPKKTPSYREGRDHNDFLCRLKDSFPNKEHFCSLVRKALSSHFLVEELSIDALQNKLYEESRRTTAILSF